MASVRNECCGKTTTRSNQVAGSREVKTKQRRREACVDAQMDNGHRIRCEMQIKTTMRDHLTPVRTAIIKKSTNHTCWRGRGANGAPTHWGWVHAGAPTRENRTEVPQNTKSRAAAQPSNPAAGCHTETRTLCAQKHDLQQLRLGHNSNAQRQMWSMDTEDAIQSYQEANNCHLWQHDGPRDYHTKRRKSEKDRFWMTSLGCGL